VHPRRSIFGPTPEAILRTFTEQQKERYLAPVLRGEKRASFAQRLAPAPIPPTCRHLQYARRLVGRPPADEFMIVDMYQHLCQLRLMMYDVARRSDPW